MSHSHRPGRNEAARQRMRRRRMLWIGTGVMALAIVAGIAVLILSRNNDELTSTANQPVNDTPATWSVTTHTGGPRLAVDRTAVDAGSVPYERPVAATYRLKNVGDAALTLGEPTVQVLEGC
jgi:hypothetical protein